MNRAGTLISFSVIAIILCVGGCKLIEADGKIWAIEPDDNFKEISGFNPVKSGTTPQHLPQVKGEGSNKVPERERELGFYNYKSFQQMSDEFGDGVISAALRFFQTMKLAHMNHALTVNNGGGMASLGSGYMNYLRGGVRSCPNQLPNHKEGELGSNKVQEHDIKLALYNHKSFQTNDVFRPVPAMRLAADSSFALTNMGGGIPSSGTRYMNYVRSRQVRGDRMYQLLTRKDEGERFNKLSVKDKQRYICEAPKPYDEVGDGGVLYISGTSGSSTKNMNYGRGEVRGHPDHNHIRKNHFASDDEGKYERLTEAMQKSREARQKLYEAAMKQNIDNKKVNDEHVLDMPEGPDHNNKKEQANTVSLMGSNPSPWASTTPASQRPLGFSVAANVVGFVGATAALSLRYTKLRAARIFANIGPLGCAWGVIMGFTSYLPGEFQWLGYVAAVFCTLAVLLANY